jgi:AcrR family transcriptional regulator
MNEIRSRLTRPESQDLTRKRLIAAAREVILADGIAAATVRAVSEAAGFSQGAFYSNFASKEHLLVEVMAAHVDGVAMRLEQLAEAVEALPGPGSDPDAVIAVVSGFFRGLNPKSNWSSLAVELQLHANRSRTIADRYAAIRTSFLQRLGTSFRRIFDHMGLEPAIPPEEIGMGMLATSVGYAIHADASMDDHARADFLGAVFTAMVRTAHRAARNG